MDADLAQKAVTYALSGKWEEAIKANQELLKVTPDDTEILNRLARAYFESGNLKKAKILSAKALKCDPFNPIATKCLAKWKGISSTKKAVGAPCQAINFIEEPGKTKLVTLLNLGDKNVIGKLNAGDEVKLSPHAHRVNIISREGKHVGRLPDDLAARLRLLITTGNTYDVYIKSLDPASIKVFIRETYKAKKAAKMQSFPPEVVRSSEPSDKAAADL